MLIALYEFKLIDNTGLDFIKKAVLEGKSALQSTMYHGEIGAMLQYFSDANVAVDSGLLNWVHQKRRQKDNDLPENLKLYRIETEVYMFAICLGSVRKQEYAQMISDFLASTIFFHSDHEAD